MVSSIRELREKAGYSQAEAAVAADCSLGTWRVFEVAPHAISPKKRADCEAALLKIREAATPAPLVSATGRPSPSTSAA